MNKPVLVVNYHNNYVGALDLNGYVVHHTDGGHALLSFDHLTHSSCIPTHTP